MPEGQSQVERAYDQVVEWLEPFEPLEDPRRQGKVWQDLAPRVSGVRRQGAHPHDLGLAATAWNAA
jgi:hypothetical protein